MLRVRFEEGAENESVVEPLRTISQIIAKENWSSLARMVSLLTCVSGGTITRLEDGLTIGPCFCFNESGNYLEQDQGTCIIVITYSIAGIQLRLKWGL